MNILYFKGSNLAQNPDLWAKTIGEYTEHHTAIVDWGKKILSIWNKEQKKFINQDIAGSSVDFFDSLIKSFKFDFVHFNDTFIPFSNYRKKSLIHYHSSCKFRKTSLDYDGYKIANAPHVANGDYSLEVKPILWYPMDLNTKIYNSTNVIDDKIIICYTPTRLDPFKKNNKVNMHSKGYSQTISILEDLKNKYPNYIDYIFHTKTPKKTVLTSKSNSNIIIDECITGNYHMSGLEGLAMGKMVIGWVNENNKKLFSTLFPETNSFPYENVHIDNLKFYLEDLIQNKKIDLVLQKGRESRLWMQKSWNLNKVINQMLAHYNEVLNK